MNPSSSTVLKHLTTLFQVGTTAGQTDGFLLDRFRSGPADEAEAAFAVLVERHGPMVFQVCRRILGDRHDAEDAAQAVFLVLARQARSIRRTDSVASWLYGVAARVAARARLDAARRRLLERRGAETATAIRDVVQRDGDGSETWPELYQELDRLPERFRLPILLCHLEGLTYEQAAQQLGCPVRTVQSRLARARERLRDRLTRRGLGPGPAVASLAAVLNPDAASAVVSESWKHLTVQAATRYAASGVSAAMVPATVAALAEGASRAMHLHRLMRWTAALLLIGVAVSGAGVGMLARSAPPEPGRRIDPAPNDDRYRASFKNGATIEVVGVSTVPTGPNTWWKPDGSPLAEAPIDAIERLAGGRHQNGEARVVLLRVSGVKKVDMFRWHPTPTASYWGGRPRKNGQDVPDLQYYEAVFRDRTDCEVEARLADGAWKTEVSNDGKGGVGTFVNGHKFSFGRARPYEAHGRSMTVFSVAHNFFEQDRRIVAVDRDGKEHAAVSYSSGSDGDKKWVIDLIDAEFPLPPDQIREYQVQFRPFEDVEIKDVALNPRPADPGAAR
ncbi:MAG: RNA polymerase sigma factor [Paludisphaera borealis]|uniref:RNA polymerase sigma factor n=1 Tax=Paludisphaera borealis TaxID=1387353 RepID=UPI00283C9E2D|nr:RNA polymerase sigma factor [Paludisphaera borealis]MDR3622848.1 RNA polymerase sigma factor [Paludisphaera borealis]